MFAKRLNIDVIRFRSENERDAIFDFDVHLMPRVRGGAVVPAKNRVNTFLLNQPPSSMQCDRILHSHKSTDKCVGSSCVQQRSSFSHHRLA